MARMKFLCDAERCIECNGCVTACKQEHDVPWGVNRRRVVTLNDGVPGDAPSRSPACTGRALHGRVPGRLLLQDRRRGVHDKDLHQLRLLLPCPFGAPQFPGRAFSLPRQDGQMHVLRWRPQRTVKAGKSKATVLKSVAENKLPACAEIMFDQGVIGRRR